MCRGLLRFGHFFAELTGPPRKEEEEEKVGGREGGGGGVLVPFQNLLMFPCSRNYFQTCSQLFDL